MRNKERECYIFKIILECGGGGGIGFAFLLMIDLHTLVFSLPFVGNAFALQDQCFISRREKRTL